MLSRATSRSESLRATIPRGIVKHFRLTEGDLLEWNLEIRGSKLTIEVSPIRKNSRIANNGSNQMRQRTLANNSGSGNNAVDPPERRRWGLRQG